MEIICPLIYSGESSGAEFSVGAAIDIAMQEIKQLYTERVVFSLTVLNSAELGSCLLMRDNVENEVSKYVYQRTQNPDATVIITSGKQLLQNKLYRKFVLKLYSYRRLH